MNYNEKAFFAEPELGRQASKFSDAVEESEGPQDTDAMYSGRQNSMNTFSTSHANLLSRADPENSGLATEDTENPEISKVRHSFAYSRVRDDEWRDARVNNMD